MLGSAVLRRPKGGGSLSPQSRDDKACNSLPSRLPRTQKNAEESNLNLIQTNPEDEIKV